MNIPFETFKNPVCKGDFALGSACGHCEKCEWIRKQSIKIIKEGDKARLLSLYRFECSRCGCIFECDNTVYKQESDYRNGSFMRAKCPTCDSDVTADIRR